ncbi:MAG: hypothetical protein KBD78_11250 [Oligoflexales bacterium]|nr:hypothetical protein [Oligoflexales bacterium]
MKNLLLFGVFLFSSAASASYLESCKMTAVVTEILYVPVLNEKVQEYTGIVKINITDSKDDGSHSSTACAEKIGKEHTFIVKKGDRYELGEYLNIDYYYASWLAPDGHSSSETWNVYKYVLLADPVEI